MKNGKLKHYKVVILLVFVVLAIAASECKPSRK